jgi:hypothetical protein
MMICVCDRESEREEKHSCLAQATEKPIRTKVQILGRIETKKWNAEHRRSAHETQTVDGRTTTLFLSLSTKFLVLRPTLISPCNNIQRARRASSLDPELSEEGTEWV